MLKNQLFLAIRPVCWAFPEEKLLHQKWGKCERRCLYWSQRETQWFRYSCVSDPCELCFAHDGAIQQVTGKGGYSMKRMCVVLLQALTSDRQSTVHIPPVLTFFFAHPASKYTPLEKPLQKILPSSTQRAKNIPPRPPFPPPPRHWLFRGPHSTSADGWPSHLFPHCTQHQFIIY